MIIKNIFGKSDGEDKNERKASINSKFCVICQESFQKGKDDYRLAHCNDCNSNGRHLQASYWKQHFLTKKTNSLSPDMARLRDKLANNQELLESNKITRSNEFIYDRNIADIRKSQASLKHVDFGVVKAQVKEIIPGILREMGISAKVDADLLVDLIVPIKIASPLVDPQSGRSALKAIVIEALEHLNVKREMMREALVKPHGEVKPFDATKDTILYEGYGRVSNDYGNYSRNLSRIAEDQMIQNQDGSFNPDVNQAAPLNPDEQFASAFAPADGEGQGDMAAPMDGDMAAQTGPSADVAGSEALEEMEQSGESGVHHLDDTEAESLMNQKAPMNNMPDNMPDNMPNEGVGTYSDVENGGSMVPDSAAMEVMPKEGVQRIESSVQDFVSRKVSYLKNQVPEKPRSTEIFSFIGKIASQLPVQSVKLSAIDRRVIESHPPISYLTANYTDGDSMNWDYYKTDGGFLMVSPSTVFHTKSLEKFADFVESDSTFSKWASLPEELQAPAFENEHDVHDMAMPNMGMPEGEGDPGFNEVPETHLNPSEDNHMGGGMMNEQEAIFDNSGDYSNPADVHSNEEELLDTASDMLPHIEKMFPDEHPEVQQDMAITAALNLLEKKANGGRFLANTHGEPMVAAHLHESNSGVNKVATDIGKAIFENIGNAAKNKATELGTQHPALKPAVDVVKPYMGVAQNSNGSGGNAVWDSVNHELDKAPALFGKSSSSPKSFALIAKKTAEFMNYIDSEYPTETRRNRLFMALEAACDFELNSYKKTPGGGGAKQFVGADKIFNKISDKSWHEAIQCIAQNNKKLKAIAADKDKSLDLAKKIANGEYPSNLFGKSKVEGPKLLVAKSTFDRLPVNAEKANNKLTANLSDFVEKVLSHLKNMEPESNILKPIVSNKKIIIMEKEIPLDKQRHIAQVLNQLMKTSDDNSKKTLMENFRSVTPHMDDDARKKELPPHLHKLHDDIANGVEDNALGKTAEKEGTEMKQSHASLLELLKITADLNQSDFELSVEALLDIGFAEGDILAIAEMRYAAEDGHRFTEKEDRQAEHVSDSEEKAGKSEKEAESIGYATVQKQKNEGK